MEFVFKKFDKKLPGLSKEDARNAGYDLFARVEGGVIALQPWEVAYIPLNIATQFPKNVVGLVFQRSSTYKKWGVKLTNNVGVVDCLYCGDSDEWIAAFRNETDGVVEIKDGDKICQAVFVHLYTAEPVEVEALGNEDRGGFGTSYDNAKEK